MRDPRTDPAPGDLIGLSDRARRVTRVEKTRVHYRLFKYGDEPHALESKRIATVTLKAWKARCTESDVATLQLGETYRGDL